MGVDGAESAALDQTVVTALVDAFGVERAQEICDVFVHDAHEKVAALQAALERGDAPAAARAAHALKSGSGFVGATAIWALCAEIERTAGVGEVAFGRDHFQELRDRFTQVEREILKFHG